MSVNNSITIQSEEHHKTTRTDNGKQKKVILILTLVALALVAVAAWYFWPEKNKKTQPASGQSQTVSEQSNKEPTKEDKTSKDDTDFNRNVAYGAGALSLVSGLFAGIWAKSKVWPFAGAVAAIGCFLLTKENPVQEPQKTYNEVKSPFNN